MLAAPVDCYGQNKKIGIRVKYKNDEATFKPGLRSLIIQIHYKVKFKLAKQFVLQGKASEMTNKLQNVFHGYKDRR